MSRASLIVTPSKPRSPRRTSSITAGDSVEGNAGSPDSAGTATWADIAILAPASIAARNGTNAPASRSSREDRTTPGPWWLSATTSPRPGKCLIEAATPAPCTPRTKAAPSRPTSAGSAPNERIPRLTFSRLRREVEHRGVDHVDAHRPGLDADRRADALRKVLVADGAERHVPGEGRGVIAKTDELAGLLVRADQHQLVVPATPGGTGIGRPLEGFGQLTDLPGRPDVRVPE